MQSPYAVVTGVKTEHLTFIFSKQMTMVKTDTVTSTLRH